MTEQRTVFHIPEANMPRLEREIAKLSKKAEKFGGWSFDPLIIGFSYRDLPNGQKTKVYEVNLDVDTIKMGDWTFVARIDHSQETGNIIRTVPNVGIDVETRFRHSHPDCEHCNHKRLRRDTFVLFNNENGEMKQVGSTCLSDFLGHDARNIGRIAEYASYAHELARAVESDPVGQTLQDRRYVDLHDYLSHCAAMVRTRGWVSGKMAYENDFLTSTRNDALDNLHRKMVEVTEEDHAVAEAALAWAQSFGDKKVLNDYEHNVLVIANSPVIEFRACGIAASIVGVYLRNNFKRAEKVTLDNMSALIGLFEKAGSRLKNPRIQISLPNTGSVELTMAKPNHKVPGSINVKKGSGWDAPWFGRITRDGVFHPSNIAPKGLDSDLVAFSTDPAGIAASHGHKTGRCCFCNLPLKDKRSTEVGYGKTCAENWGQPWGATA